MKAAILENNKFKIVNDMQKPVLEETGAIIKVIGCGLCGSDIVKLRSGAVKNGTVLGHEVIGEITEINSNTEFETGDKIALGHHIPCFNCSYCYGGSYSMCRHFKSTNIVPGGFAEYIYVSEEHLKNTVFRVNQSLSDIEASFLEPLGCCIRAVKRADIKDNFKTLIVGLGSIGILMGETIKAFGNPVFGCDILEERVALSEKFGFDKSFVMNDENSVLKEMKKIAPLGFDRVILTAGASSAVETALKAARDGASIVVFSSIKNDLGFRNNDIYYRELTVLSSYSSTPMDLEDSMQLLESGRIKTDGISTVYSLENINEALNDTISNKIMKAYIKL